MAKTIKISANITLPEGFKPEDDDVREWIKYELGVRGDIEFLNPLNAYELRGYVEKLQITIITD